MLDQGGSSKMITKQIKKCILRFPKVFSKFGKTDAEIIKLIDFRT